MVGCVHSVYKMHACVHTHIHIHTDQHEYLGFGDLGKVTFALLALADSSFCAPLGVRS